MLTWIREVTPCVIEQFGDECQGTERSTSATLGLDECSVGVYLSFVGIFELPDGTVREIDTGDIVASREPVLTVGEGTERIGTAAEMPQCGLFRSEVPFELIWWLASQIDRMPSDIC